MAELGLGRRVQGPRGPGEPCSGHPDPLSPHRRPALGWQCLSTGRKGALRPFLGREGAWGRPLPRPGRHLGSRGTPLESWLLCPSHGPGPDDASRTLRQDVVPDPPPPPGPFPSTARPAWGSQLPEPTRLWTMAGNAELRPWARRSPDPWERLEAAPHQAQAPLPGVEGRPKDLLSRGGWPWTAAHGARLVEDSGDGSRWPLYPGPSPTQASGSYAHLHPPRTSPSSRPRWVHGAKRRGLRNAPRHSGMLPLWFVGSDSGGTGAPTPLPTWPPHSLKERHSKAKEPPPSQA